MDPKVIILTEKNLAAAAGFFYNKDIIIKIRITGKRVENMRMIISPAKKMNCKPDLLAWRDLPVFLQQAGELKSWIQSLGRAQAKALWVCNDKLADLNYERFQRMDLESRLTPAILSYEGIQYQYMAPGVFDENCLRYIQEHLRILSGFYGILKPLDGVVPYRLEMQAKIGKQGHSTCRTLYEFWGESLYRVLKEETDCIINLASREYAKAVEDYLDSSMEYITCVFGEWKDGKVIQKGTMAKMARGEMVRFMAEEKISRPLQLKQFDRLGYRYSEELSGDREYVFLSEGNEPKPGLLRNDG